AGGRATAAGDRRSPAAHPRDGQPAAAQPGVHGPAQRPAADAAAAQPGTGPRGTRRRRPAADVAARAGLGAAAVDPLQALPPLAVGAAGLASGPARADPEFPGT